MRFIIVKAPSLEKLCDKLNNLNMGSGRVISVQYLSRSVKALVDMYPTHVVTTEELWDTIDNNLALTA